MRDGCEGELPIKIDTTSNGEFPPLPLDRVNQAGNQQALQQLAHTASRHAVPRRKFLGQLRAAALTLLSFNAVNFAAGRRGGFFELDAMAADEADAAAAALGGDEFIFDVQGHYVVPGSLVHTLKPNCAADHASLSREYMRCLGADRFIKDIFLDSDTDMMVLSFIPSRRDQEPLTAAEAAATQEIVAAMGGSGRLLVHGRVNPNQPGDVEAMDELKERYQVSAWKCYTQWGPDGQGFFLHDAHTGIRLIENAERLGVRTICIHKGIPFGQRSYEHSLCTDVGVVAKQFPNINFLVYHSGYIPGEPEGPYRPQRGAGVDELIASVERNGLGQNSNVYAELGSTWRMLMRNPEEAAHCIGKLVKHLGPGNVLYGSDCVWYGSPQDQIQAMRTFQISKEFQERFAYPEITPQLRAAILGGNAARVYGVDPIKQKPQLANDYFGKARAKYQHEPTPHFQTYGPKTQAEFVRLLAAGGAGPG